MGEHIVEPAFKAWAHQRHSVRDAGPGAFEREMDGEGRWSPALFGQLAGHGRPARAFAQQLVERYGVAPGSNGVVFTNNDDGLRTALDLQAKGVPGVLSFDPAVAAAAPFRSASRAHA